MSEVIIGKRRSGKTTKLLKSILAHHEPVCTFYSFSRQSAGYAMDQLCYMLKDQDVKFEKSHNSINIKILNKTIYFKYLQLDSTPCFLDEANLSFEGISLTARVNKLD